MPEEKKNYTPSKKTELAEQALTMHENARPEGYTSLWEAQLQAAMDKILNREDFTYRLDGDALYRQYRDAAIRDGRTAMADTMGAAAALTGGYGNSYAATAGQQAYANQLDRLNDRIPELYNLALARYREQGDRMLSEYELLSGQENRDYSRYQDALSDWERRYDALAENYRDSRDFDYGAYQFETAYQQWAAEFEEDLRRFQLEWDEAHPESGGGGGSGGTRKTTGSAISKQAAYDMILEHTVSMAKSGESWNSIQNYLGNAVNYGAISAKQSSTIADKALDAKPKSR